MRSFGSSVADYAWGSGAISDAGKVKLQDRHHPFGLAAKDRAVRRDGGRRGSVTGIGALGGIQAGSRRRCCAPNEVMKRDPSTAVPFPSINFRDGKLATIGGTFAGWKNVGVQ